MKQVIRTLIAAMVLAIVAAAPVLAEDGARIFNRKGCDICHGANGSQTLKTSYPKLAGQHKSYIVAQLQAFKAKQRNSVNAKEMIPFANSLNEEQMNAIAEYLSQQ